MEMKLEQHLSLVCQGDLVTTASVGGAVVLPFSLDAATVSAVINFLRTGVSTVQLHKGSSSFYSWQNQVKAAELIFRSLQMPREVFDFKEKSESMPNSSVSHAVLLVTRRQARRQKKKEA